MASERTVCPIRVMPKDAWGRGYLCGKPVKSDGLCGVHAAAKRRREAHDTAHTAKLHTSGENQAAALAALEELGIDGQAHYSSVTFLYTGKVIVSIEDLKALRDRHDH